MAWKNRSTFKNLINVWQVTVTDFAFLQKKKKKKKWGGTFEHHFCEGEGGRNLNKSVLKNSEVPW